jgi:glycosyltransferase involved in cell wall biosynthesis
MASNKIQMNISLCITTYNRTELLFESFEQVINDPRVSEIVIVDDHSPIGLFTDISYKLQDNDKVKLFRNDVNLDCYRNKREAVSKATNEWVIIFDSDNIMTRQYIDRIENLFIGGLNAKTVYQPSFAEPHFNFTKYEGTLVDKSNVGKYLVDATFGTMLNAMNYFVNRDEYLRVWDGSVDPVTSDSIYQNLNWFKGGNNMYVVPGLTYSHRVHDGSHYQNNHKRTPRGFHQEVEQQLKALK